MGGAHFFMLAPENTSYQTQADKPHFKPTDPVFHVFLAYTPLMQVVEAVRIKGPNKEKRIAGILCCWFSPEGDYKTATFNTAMLRHAQPTELPVGYQPRQASAVMS